MRVTGKSVQARMGIAERSVHMVLIAFTAGCWLPVYIRRKHTIERTTVHMG